MIKQLFFQLRYKNKLTELRKYKNVIAVVLLAVYAFIATPVQWWHHHNYCTVTSVSSLQSGSAVKITASNAANKIIENNCQICSHHYSIYSSDNVNSFKIFSSTCNPKDGLNAPAIPLAPYLNSTNKGPPSLS